MSFYFRRLIARKIVQSINGRVKQSEEKLVKDITQCIQLIPITNKTSINNPQYVLKKGWNLNPLTQECKDQLQNLTVTDLPIEESPKDLVREIYINDKEIKFKIDSKSIIKAGLSKIWKEKQNFGYSPLRNEESAKTVIVEYSSPNIAKPFHVGHLRSTILGHVLSNLYEATGNKVIRLNYLGDWGTQFGLLSHGFKKYGDPEELQNNALHHLYKVYVQINKDVEEEKQNGNRHTLDEGLKIFKKLEEGDEEELATWKKFCDLSLAEYSRLYERFGIKFTAYESESMYREQTKDLIKRLKSKNLLKINRNGVGYVKIKTPDPDVNDVKLLKSDGTSLYITRDIAAILDRYERYKFDIIHYVVDDSQMMHFEQMVALLRKMKIDWPAISDVENVHIRFGRIRGMSTRKGTVVFLDDIVMEAKEQMLESMADMKTTRTTDAEEKEEIAEVLGLTAVIVQNLVQRRIHEYEFNWDKVLSDSSNTGIHLQYVHARLCSLIEKNASISLDHINDITDSMVDCLCEEPTAYRLILEMMGYEDAVEVALLKKDPIVITQLLFRICHFINKSYMKLQIQGMSHEIAVARLLVFFCARIVLRNIFTLLGLQPLDKI